MIAKTLESEKNSVDASDEVEKVPKDVLLIAQQIKIARSLASNDLRQRTKQLKKLKKWFNLRANSSYREYCDEVGFAAIFIVKFIWIVIVVKMNFL